jgi:hypothetical protein
MCVCTHGPYISSRLCVRLLYVYDYVCVRVLVCVYVHMDHTSAVDCACACYVCMIMYVCEYLYMCVCTHGPYISSRLHMRLLCVYDYVCM